MTPVRILSALLALTLLSPLAAPAAQALTFEEWTANNPSRNQFPTTEGLAALELLRRQETETGIFLSQGHLAKDEDDLDTQMLNLAARKFNDIYEGFLRPAGCPTYFAMIPSKQALLPTGRSSPDYDAMAVHLAEEMPGMTHLDLTQFLSLEDFYRTDSHWRQEKITDVAAYFGQVMGANVYEPFSREVFTRDFRGTYMTDVPLELPLEPDTLYFLTSPTLRNCHVETYDLMGRPQDAPLYDYKKRSRWNPYDFFLSGTQALITIENPAGPAGKELVIFRDSFGSSLAPLLVPGYRKITLVDLRYVNGFMMGALVDFHGQDALFLYSSLMLFSSLALR